MDGKEVKKTGRREWILTKGKSKIIFFSIVVFKMISNKVTFGLFFNCSTFFFICLRSLYIE